MIPYLDIHDKYTLKTVALVEPQECWLELSYQDVGEFEIYCQASYPNINALQKGRYVTIPNKRFIWVITSIRYTHNASGSRMIIAKGYEAKWLLKKRCILLPKELSGTITRAVYGLVNHALGTGANAARKIEGFTVDTNDLLIDISGTQAPRENLLEFVNALLINYNCGSIVTYEKGKLKYTVFTGRVKTRSVRFSQSLDNLLSSEYLTDESQKATFSLVVSTVETEQTDGSKKDIEYPKEYNHGETGIDRAEIYTDSKVSTKYEDAIGEEQETTPDSALYQGWLYEEAKNNLADKVTTEEMSGEIDIANSKYTFDEHFFLGDIVRAHEEYFNYFIDTKIKKFTFKQDANGYGEEAEYGG